MTGKDKCKVLKQIRKDIAEKNEIPFETSECKHRGECRGTCPKCEAEIRYLEKAIKAKKRMGKKAVLAGVSAATMLGLTGCSAEMMEDIADVVVRYAASAQNKKTDPVPDDGEVGYIEELDGDIADIQIDDPDDQTAGILPEEEAETEAKYVELAGEVEYCPPESDE